MRLEKLYLNDTLVTGDGLKQIEGLRALEVLDLRGTRVNGLGVKHLKGLTALKELSPLFGAGGGGLVLA